SAPLGAVKLIASYNGLASEPYALTLVDTAFGFLNADTAPDELPDARRPISTTPGALVSLWGSGLGTARPRIFVGGKSAHVRHVVEEDCCRGVVRIEFEIPSDAATGCSVPVQAIAAGRPSNVISISITASGQVCRDPLEWFEQTAQRAERAGFLVLARVALL